MKILLLLLGITFLPAPVTMSQPLIDTLFTWRSYDRVLQCRLRLYPCPEKERCEKTAVLDELASNDASTATRDAAHLAELVGRQYGFDAARANWVFHWGAFSFEGAGMQRSKELFLRARFQRTRSGTLGAAAWRVLTREELEEITDRRWID